jgi:hypothetical protein
MKLSVRRCPHCHSHEVFRSRRRGMWEKCVFPLLLLRPVRCYTCMRRHLRFSLIPAEYHSKQGFEQTHVA